jgi:hypothetical protein
VALCPAWRFSGQLRIDAVCLGRGGASPDGITDDPAPRWTVSLRCLSWLFFCRCLGLGWGCASVARVATPPVVEDLDVLMDGRGFS